MERPIANKQKFRYIIFKIKKQESEFKSHIYSKKNLIHLPQNIFDSQKKKESKLTTFDSCVPLLPKQTPELLISYKYQLKRLLSTLS